MNTDLGSLGWDGRFAAAYASFDHPAHRPARVARVDRGVCTVLTRGGTDRASLSGGLLSLGARDRRELPCAGDWVVVRAWPDERVTVEAVLPRRTRVVRASADLASHGQVLAANIDVAAVVEPMHPAPDPGRVERLLALAWESGATPLVILTKSDLLARPEPVAAQMAEIAPGVEVITVSARTGVGLSDVRPLVAAGRTLGLLGPSGAGKSTMVNALAGVTVMATQQIRRADGRGRHTTTHRALVPLPGGGAVLDTPGLRAVGLFEDDGLDRVFADVEALAERCRFPNCKHEVEPDCAVLDALERGELSRRRYDSWRRLQRELAWQVRRHHARLRAQAREQWKRRQAEQRDARARRDAGPGRTAW